MLVTVAFILYIKALDCSGKVNVCQTMMPAQMTSWMLGFINTLLDLAGRSVGERDGCLMAPYLITLQATMKMGNLAFKTKQSPNLNTKKDYYCF